MKRLLTATLAAMLSLSAVKAAAQNTNSSNAAPASGNASAAGKRGPVFRATKEQIKQAQGLLKQRGLYAGEPTGKLDTATREALRKYQEVEGIKVTGTLNAATLRKMSITLNDRQKAWLAAQEQSRK